MMETSTSARRGCCRCVTNLPVAALTTTQLRSNSRPVVRGRAGEGARQAGYGKGAARRRRVAPNWWRPHCKGTWSLSSCASLLPTDAGAPVGVMMALSRGMPLQPFIGYTLIALSAAADILAILSDSQKKPAGGR